MSEKAGAVTATRSGNDSLGAVYGQPDSALTDTISFSGTAAEKTDMVAQKWYRFQSTAACHVRFGSGDATTSDLYLTNFGPEYFYMGHLTRISVIQASGAGILHVTPMITDDKATP